MRYTIALQRCPERAVISAQVGTVEFNGVHLLPHEADMLAQALEDCAKRAEDKAADVAAGYVAKYLAKQPEPVGV